MNPKQFASDKILHHLVPVHDWLNGFNPFVITMEIDPTDECNHNCPGCAGGRQKSGDRWASLTGNEMGAALLGAEDLGVRGVVFTGGGEPLMNPATIEVLKNAGDPLEKRRHFDIGLITNGSFMEGIENTLLRVCAWIRISVDAGNIEMHRKTHGANDFHKIVDNIINLVKVKESMGYECTIGVGYLTGKGTSISEEIVEFIDLAVAMGVDYAQFRPYHTQAKRNLSDFTPIDWEPFMAGGTEKTDILISKHKYDSMAMGEAKRNYEKCYGHQFATTLCANGNLTICCHTRGLKWATLGNIKEKTLGEIWESQERQGAIDRIVLDECPLYCRCDTFNEILWQMKQRKEHVNFL